MSTIAIGPPGSLLGPSSSAVGGSGTLADDLAQWERTDPVFESIMYVLFPTTLVNVEGRSSL